jgi:hypothetical protein
MLLTLTFMKILVPCHTLLWKFVDPFIQTSRTWFLDWQLSKTYHMIEDDEPILERAVG